MGNWNSHVLRIRCPCTESAIRDTKYDFHFGNSDIILPMGFPTWTLIGMGVTGLGALIMITLAYLAQSPQFMTRIGLAGARLDLRVRAFTGLALALLLLAFGFFLAGVPLNVPDETAVSTPNVTVSAIAVSNGSDAEDNARIGATVAMESTVTPSLNNRREASPESGAFDGPPPTETPIAPIDTSGISAGSDLLVEGTITITPSPLPTNTLPPTETLRPTSTPTASPTVTPTPTLTPTPIEGETAVINTGGSTLWVRRTPGGQPLSLVRNGDLVVLSSGHANQGGILWQEIRTVDGVLGWVQEEFLTLNN